jgi:hypothetical protein
MSAGLKHRVVGYPHEDLNLLLNDADECIFVSLNRQSESLLADSWQNPLYPPEPTIAGGRPLVIGYSRGYAFFFLISERDFGQSLPTKFRCNVAERTRDLQIGFFFFSFPLVDGHCQAVYCVLNCRRT